MYFKKDLINYKFSFKFNDERTIKFDIKIEPLTMTLLRDSFEIRNGQRWSILDVITVR
jgi:hypothetical protein